jgi:hypothetical protein
MKRQVFYSFHFDNDVMRVQQVRNIGAIEGNAPVSVNDWETVKRGGNIAIKKWIDDNMRYKNAVVVLIGEETANRPWVKYEIEKAWNEGRALLGIHIHNLRDPKSGTCRKGANPFDGILVNYGHSQYKLSTFASCYDPNSMDAYNDIARNLESWVESAIRSRQR